MGTYVLVMDGRISPREQGDIGERSALCWLIDQGATVYLPFGHSPDVDLVAGFGDRLVRVQVKTSNCVQKVDTRSPSPHEEGIGVGAGL
jgi:hypothetical protein